MKLRMPRMLARANGAIAAGVRVGLKAAQMRWQKTTMSVARSVRWGKIDVLKYVGDGRNSSIVMAVVQWLMRSFPEAPLAVYALKGDGSRSIVAGHSMIRKLRRPNPYYTSETLWQATIADFALSGNAYWRKIRNIIGEVIELWWMPSTLVDPISKAETVYIEYYEYGKGRGKERIDPDDVVHFRFGLDPANPRKGISPIASALREVFTDDEAAAYVGTLLHNMGVPGVVIAPTGNNEIPDETAIEIKDMFPGKFSAGNRGEPYVFTVPASVTTMSFNPQEMNLRELRRIPEERVTAVLGIAAIVAGLGAGLDRSTFANYQEANEAAYRQNIIPTQRQFAATIDLQLLPDFGNAETEEAEFDNSRVNALQEDQTAIYQRVNMGVLGGWLTVGQALDAVGMQADATNAYYLRSRSVVPVPLAEAGASTGAGTDSLSDEAIRAVQEALAAGTSVAAG